MQSDETAARHETTPVGPIASYNERGLFWPEAREIEGCYCYGRPDFVRQPRPIEFTKRALTMNPFPEFVEHIPRGGPHILDALPKFSDRTPQTLGRPWMLQYA